MGLNLATILAPEGVTVNIVRKRDEMLWMDPMCR